MENSTGNADKKSTKTGKNDKTKEKHWNILGQKGNINTRKIAIQLEEINQKVLAKEGKIKRYRERVKQYRQTGHFKTMKENSTYNLGEMTLKNTDNQMQEKLNKFGVKYNNQENNTKAEWISNMAKELEGLEEGLKAKIHIDLLRTALKKISNWKTSGHDRIHKFWFKKFTYIYERQALEMNRSLQEAHVPKWMTKRKTTLIQKVPLKGSALNNYRPITCQPMMWKILAAQIGEEIYYSLISCRLYLRNNGYRKGSRGWGKQLYIDHHILNKSKTRRKKN